MARLFERVRGRLDFLCRPAHLRCHARTASGHWSFEMAHTLARGDAPIGYRFRRTAGRGAGVHSRSALRRVSFYFRSTIEAIANAKLRRMERELELRGIRPGRFGDD